jgi:hypothetical protein
MAVGQVSFHDQRKVKRILVAQRENPIVNRLNKTKVEKQPDLAAEKEARLKELRKRDQTAQLARVGIRRHSSIFPFALKRRAHVASVRQQG